MEHKYENDVENEVEDNEEDIPVPVEPGKPYLLPSYYGTTLTSYFPYPPEQTNQHKYKIIPAKGKVLKALRFSMHYVRSCVTRTFVRAGYYEVDPENNRTPYLLGFIQHFSDNKEYEYLEKYQKVSHLPGTWIIGRKDNLCRLLSPLVRIFPEYQFHPKTYKLPEDASLLTLTITQYPDAIFILKPRASSCGRGIQVVSNSTVKNLLQYDDKCLIQDYISNPLLIDGYKFDLRLYVLVTSFSPLRLYIYDDGLVRFASEKYDTKNLKNRFIHLTNTTINEKNSNYGVNSKSSEETHSKWGFEHLRRYFAENNIDSKQIFSEIHRIITLTMIATEQQIGHLVSLPQKMEHQCFELFGVDVMIDDDLKPWLIEVNICPALKSSSFLDRKVKDSLLADTFNIVGPEPYKVNRVPQKKYEEIMSKLGPEYNTRRAELDLLEEKRLERHIIRMEEEYDRRGLYHRVFPTEYSRDDMKYFKNGSKANEICISFLEKKYNVKPKIVRQQKGGQQLDLPTKKSSLYSHVQSKVFNHLNGKQNQVSEPLFMISNTSPNITTNTSPNMYSNESNILPNPITSSNISPNSILNSSNISPHMISNTLMTSNGPSNAKLISNPRTYQHPHLLNIEYNNLHKPSFPINPRPEPLS